MIFNWVSINNIAIGTPPKNDKDISFLLHKGVKSILTLCDQNEGSWWPQLEKTFICKRIILPDHKFDRCLNLSELNSAVEELEYLIQDGIVFVHCFAAIERSPLVCMGWLVKYKRFSAINSLSYLMEVNSGTNPSMKQFEIIKKLQAS